MVEILLLRFSCLLAWQHKLHTVGVSSKHYDDNRSNVSIDLLGDCAVMSTAPYDS